MKYNVHFKVNEHYKELEGYIDHIKKTSACDLGKKISETIPFEAIKWGNEETYRLEVVAFRSNDWHCFKARLDYLLSEGHNLADIKTEIAELFKIIESKDGFTSPK